LRSVLRPAIHIRAGEKVCIQVITPTQSSSELASFRAWRIESESVSGSRSSTGNGIAVDSSRAAAIRRA
jgi:hypothetical protein